MVNWNFCEDPYPGPDEFDLAETWENLKRIYRFGKRLLVQQDIEYEQYFTASPPAVSWSSAAADPIKDLRDAMASMGKPALVMGERMKEVMDAFKDLPITPVIPKFDTLHYETTDGKKKQRTHGPRADFGFDRFGRKVR